MGKTLNIAILGSRGIPCGYGGFETCAEELGSRLVEYGHRVTVYCLRKYTKGDDPYYKGIKRVFLPSAQIKSLEKIVFSLFSLFHVIFTNNDVVLMLGVSASAFCFLPRLVGKRVIINVDGLEWKRKKWGRVAAFYLRLSERAACYTANEVVTDAKHIQTYYRTRYRLNTVYIPYGVRSNPTSSNGILRSLGLNAGEYVLYVSRLEPENNPLLVRRAFERVKTEKRLVMLGDAPYAQNYIKKVRDTRDGRILFPGAIYGDGYLELQSNAYSYIQATEVGGVHPALVEAVGFGNCIVALDVPEHREVLDDAAIYFDGTESDLTRNLQEVLDNPDLRSKYRERVKPLAHKYRWEHITKEYESLFSG